MLRDEKPKHGLAAYRYDLQERIAHHRRNLERAERLLKMIDDDKTPVKEFLEIANTPVEE